MTQIPSIPSINTGWGGTRAAPTAEDQSLGKDAFLKLLVAQLKYQDPSNPTDSNQFMAQTAQFTLVEKFEEVSAMTESLLATQRSQTAVSLVGQKVTYTGDKDVKKTGLVTGVSMESGEPILTIDGQKVRLDAVVEVGESPAS